VSFDSLTDVDYHDYEVYFDNIDMYENGSSSGNGARISDVDVMVIKGNNEDSFLLKDDIETDTLYLQNSGNGLLQVYYMDLAEDYSTGKPVRYANIDISAVTTAEANVTAAELALTNAEATVLVTNNSITQAAVVTAEADVTAAEAALVTVKNSYIDIADLIADETEMVIGISAGGDTLSITGSYKNSNIEISLGGNNTYLGTIEEDAASSDVKVDGKSIGKYDNDVMDYYGTIVESPQNNADDDKVVFKVPSEQLYAQVSVLGSEEDTVASNATVVKPTAAELGIAKITDANLAAASGKNIIVVGGSCINTVSASLLGGKACGAEFTAITGVVAGKVLIQTFDMGEGQFATVVAGYNAEDTTRGIQYLLSNNINIADGEKVII